MLSWNLQQNIEPDLPAYTLRKCGLHSKKLNQVIYFKISDSIENMLSSVTYMLL